MKVQINADINDSLELKFETLGKKIKDAVHEAIKADIERIRSEFNAKLSDLSNKLEKNITAKMSSMLESRVSCEVASAKQQLADEINIPHMKKELKAYADAVRSTPSNSFEDQKKRIVIKGIPQEPNESEQCTADKVNALIRDGCKLSHIRVTKVQRVQPRGKGPGPIIATVDSFEQKQTLMRAKRVLMNSNNYKRVFIENDYGPEVRKSDSNWRTILKEIGKQNQYRVAGGKLFPVRQREETPNKH